MIQDRIYYVDYIKGFAVLWIVWIHTTHPDFVSVPVRNTLFFFVSGIFFKDYPYKVFFKKKIQGLLIPFLFFYCISYVFRIALHYWDFKEIATFNYLCIFDLFRWESQSDYLFVNVPLWFLLALFNMQLLLLVITKIAKKQKHSSRIFYALITLVVLLGFVLERYPVPLPFMIRQSFTCSIYFIGGMLFGKKLIQYIANYKQATIVFVVSLIAFSSVCASPLSDLLPSAGYMFISTLCFIPIVFVIFQSISKFKLLSPFNFFGMNSLIVLAAHSPILIVLKRTTYKYWGATITTGIIDTLLTIIVLYFLILFLNKYFYYFVGKKPIVKIDRAIDWMFSKSSSRD